MYNFHGQYPGYSNIPQHNYPYNMYKPYPYPYYPSMYNYNHPKYSIQIKDYGPEPFVININEATKQNNNFRTTLWTGEHLQITLMSINPGEDIGLEIHPNIDQFIRIEQGEGIVKMGNTKYNLNFQEKLFDDYALVIPAGKWHNIINTGNIPMKLYSIYAPPEHPWGTIHKTKAEAEADEKTHCY
ncbi:cupin domain-containing protein [Defluviitalea phaphyphila]|nr:cupin domain-containing protein [Defluviitalea phaphyphila]